MVEREFQVIFNENLRGDFSEEAKLGLKRNHYVVCRLNGRTVLESIEMGLRAGLKDEDMEELLSHFPGMWDSDNMDNRVFTSRRSEIAFDPQNLYLQVPPRDAQIVRNIVEELSQDLRKTISEDITAIVTEPPDYADLEITHRIQTGEKLLDMSRCSFALIDIPPAYRNFTVVAKQGQTTQIASMIMAFNIPVLGNVVVPVIVPRLD